MMTKSPAPNTTESAEESLVNLRTLKRFLTICHSGSVSRAADRLGVSQPVLSRELADLERHLGVALLNRHSRGITLTPSGKALVQKAESILESVESIKQDVQLEATVARGRVVLGMPISMHEMLTAPLLARMRERFPEVLVHLGEGMSGQMHEALAARRVDVAVMASPVSSESLIVRQFAQEQMYLIGPPISKLDEKRSVSIADVARLPLILPGFPSTARIMVEGAFQRAGMRPNVVMEADTPVVSFVERGLGFAFQPSCAALSPAVRSTRIVQAPVDGMTITWVLALPAGLALSKAAAQVCHELYGLARELIEGDSWKATYLGPRGS